jgi:hypothetical protein
MEQRFCCVDPLIFENENKFDESPVQGSRDNLYYKAQRIQNSNF